MIDDAFGHWLSGFTDGEGCFLVTPVEHYFRCAFTIELRLDDRPILEEIRNRTGLGSMKCRERTGGLRKAQACWTVGSKADCASLVEIFERYPLRAKKARDFEVWKLAVREHAATSSRGGARGDHSTLRALSDRLRAIRAYDVTA